MVGIQRLIYSDKISTNIKNYTFGMWQDKFSKIGTPTGAQMVNSTDDLINILNDRGNIEHQVLLRIKPSASEYPSITDDFDCVFPQGNPLDKDSDACIHEDYLDCKYWQTCDFKAVKVKDCEVTASRVIALVVPIVIFLLIIAIIAIYYFKKKVDKAQKGIEEINNRRPVLGPQDLSRYNSIRRCIIQNVSKFGEDSCLKTSSYNEITTDVTPGISNTNIWYTSHETGQAQGHIQNYSDISFLRKGFS